jgi:superfamily II DNA/RNA helicase
LYFLSDQNLKRFQFVANELTPVFWSDPSPQVAAKRIVSFHRAALRNSMARTIYRSCLLRDLQGKVNQLGCSSSVNLLQCYQLPFGSSLNSLGLVNNDDAKSSSIKSDVEFHLAQQHCLPAMLRGDDVMLVDRGIDRRMNLISFIIAGLRRIDVKMQHPQCLIFVPSDLPTELIDECLELSMQSSPDHRIAHIFIDRNDSTTLEAFHSIVARIENDAVVSNLLALELKHLASLMLFDIEATPRYEEACTQMLRKLPSQMQICSCSKTCSTELRNISSGRSRNLVVVTADDNEPNFEHVRQFYLAIEKEEWKLDTVCDLFEGDNETPCLVLCKDERTCDRLALQLQEREFASARLHANHAASERAAVLREFASGIGQRVLIASYASTGFAEVPANAYAILYDLPKDPEQYLYAIGRRDGRRGRDSIALTFLKNDDVATFRSIQAYHGFVGPRAIEEAPMDIFDLM